ncbi:hypothetical protein BDN72DRAFT_891353 [Pluteus cervinus]|uniref:Uncharacterized protein n=1 Tax=Pluteus cervinus TaxID=181527 RepID=A0ACD3BE98_9AGAR|nr:hypothetical protein BDN72DRAFT_891353 [Pluteus cervinus]
MPSTTLQSRISAFESIAQASSLSQTSPTRASSRLPPKSPHNNAQLQSPISPTIVALLPPKLPFSPPKSMPMSPSPPDLGRKTSLIDLKDWVVDVAASNLSPNGYAMGHNGSSEYTPTPTQRSFDASEGPSNTPLINLESPPKPKPKPKPKALSALPLNAKIPPLPPRKPSYTSLQSASSSPISIHRNGSTNGSLASPRSDTLTVEHTYPPLRLDREGRPGHAPASSISSFHSVSLSSDTGSSTPGSLSNFVATFPVDHDRDSSFGNGSEGDSISLDESYENVSTPSMTSPSNDQMDILDWQRTVSTRNVVPPKLPQRPSSSSKTPQLPSRPQPLPGSSRSIPSSPNIRPALSTASSSSTLSSMARRPPPPPPPASRSSNRSSIQSTITSFSLTSSSTTSYRTLSVRTKRPTPVPPAARARFEALFNANVIRRRKADKQRDSEKPPLLSPSEARRTRQAAGWRGLSVDLITGGDSPVLVNKEDAQPNETMDEEVGLEERLEGKYVKQIWSKSGLTKAQLKEIWAECDTNNQGCLDRNAFVRGMWRIDEDLRRSQMQAIKSASTLSLGSSRGRSYPVSPTPPKPRAILT